MSRLDQSSGHFSSIPSESPSEYRTKISRASDMQHMESTIPHVGLHKRTSELIRLKPYDVYKAVNPQYYQLSATLNMELGAKYKSDQQTFKSMVCYANAAGELGRAISSQVLSQSSKIELLAHMIAACQETANAADELIELTTDTSLLEHCKYIKDETTKLLDGYKKLYE